MRIRKSRVWNERFRSIEEMVPGIERLFDEYDADAVGRVWQGLFEWYHQVLGALGGNDFDVRHGGIATNRKTGELVIAVPITDEAYRRQNIGITMLVRTTAKLKAEFMRASNTKISVA